MLEILILWTLTKRIGNIVENKGHKSGRYKLLTVLLWFGGEIAGAILGALLTGAEESAQCTVYIFALLGAATGAGIAYWIANSLSLPHTLAAPVSPDPASIVELLADLESKKDFESVRALAARNLGELSASNLRIVNALITALESDPSPVVRREAARSLAAPALQAVLQQHPELLSKVDELSAQDLSGFTNLTGLEIIPIITRLAGQFDQPRGVALHLGQHVVSRPEPVLLAGGRLFPGIFSRNLENLNQILTCP